ncbi:MAG: DUF3090 family protein [Chloroflexota bacterium]|nr:DUF3090 family protein [Chloroflexota bacterium]MDE2941973.1 DUF3090 family protein [Chloroflexota bacterium]MDE3267071.1 DUF3090 family protein [Chloroflexota bacterium]
MVDAKHDLGLVDAVKAEAIGVPGQRRFRLLLESPGGSACLWLEKGQLFQLSLAIRQMLARADATEAEQGEQTDHNPPPSSHASLEFEVGNLSLGHEPAGDLFVIEAFDRDDDEDEPLLGFWASRTQMEELAEEAQAVCAAGRPICPLCNGPIDAEGHMCVRTDGHQPM